MSSPSGIPEPDAFRDNPNEWLIRGVNVSRAVPSSSTPASRPLWRTMQPIDRMPEEILIHIFTFALLRMVRDGIFKIRGRKVKSKVDVDALVTLCHVNRSWRGVLVGYPPFWTRTDGHNRDQLEQFITRSQFLPVSLFLTSLSTDLYEILSTHGSRARRLDFTLLPSLVDPCTFPLSDCKVLECVTLNFDYDLRVGQPFYHASPFFLFGADSLFFKALAISPISGCLPASRFPHLTHLYIGFDIRWGDDAIHFSSTIFDFLYNVPRLEFLSIHGLDGSPDTYPISSQVPVHLDYLRFLTISAGEFASAASVLDALAVPQTASLRLHNLTVITDEAPQLPPAGVPKSMNHLSIETRHVGLSLTARGPDSTLWLDAFFTQDPFDEPWNIPPSWSSWLSDLPAWIPVGQVTRFEVSVDAHADVVLGLLPLMPQITELCIRPKPDNNVHSPVMRALYSILAKEEPLLCPRLHTLNVVLTDHRVNLCSSDLATMLEVRRHCGHALKNVIIAAIDDQDYLDDVGQVLGSLINSEDLELKAITAPLVQFREEVPAYTWYHDSHKYWDFDEDLH